jgi:NAD(P)-dependent dehydrogenase (short-subunit alcohol dehydrogenase family)
VTLYGMSVAVITGTSTRIGYATALRLARDGYRVVATMRNPSSCDLAAKAETEGLQVEVRALDVTDARAVGETFAGILDDHGQVDVLVNNAGISIGGVVEEAGLDAYSEVMETNFVGALRCTKAVLPAMRERGAGCIVSVSSQAGKLAVPTLSTYCASKWALEAVMEALSIEVHRFGIRVAIIEPGAILTPIWGKMEQRAPEGPYAHLIARLSSVVIHDVSKGSTAEEVADCIAEAIATDSPKLRWLVGQGAERNVSNRQSWTDEQTIEIWNQPDDDGFMKAILAGEPT